MNLFIRLFFLGLWRTLRPKPKIGLYDPCPTRFRVWLTDHDVFGHMTYSRYLSHFGLSILDYHLRTGLSKLCARHGWFPVVTHEEISFYKSLRWPQTFTITTHVPGWTTNFIAVSHRVERKGKVIAEGLTIGRFVGPKGKKVTVPELVEAFGSTETPPTLPPELQAKLDGMERDAEARAAARVAQPTKS